jgi:hypothetical protein
MPERTHLQSLLIVGSGPIGNGEAAECDYSATVSAVTRPHAASLSGGPAVPFS